MSSTENLDEIPFEQALERLESIVSRMEEGKLPLDQMIKCFEEGSALSAACGKKLKSLERKIEVLVKENSSGGDWKNFEEASPSPSLEEEEEESVPVQKTKKSATQEDLPF
ncbi:MAG: exodeoxyribonuclease VII small subunit [Lentisphaerae bacterium GWF2_52_8]|nr:MAG: exodeoxyribonuclease VII small subunit [Lentisphaerae bacterium GWF2_52_8]